jgi:hypothetical protein
MEQQEPDVGGAPAPLVVDLVQALRAPPQAKRGAPLNSTWAMFSDEPSVHNSKHAHCKHCKQSVALHCKVEKAKQHLLSCLPFGRAMARADSAERPDWWMNKTAKSSISSSARNATTSQADIRNFAIPALKPSEGRELDKLVAMHIYTTGSAFQRVEDPYLHKAFNLCRPGVRLPTRQRLGGELLDACYKEIKKEVDRSLQAAHRCCCITSDAWSNISNEPVVNYMAIMREKSLANRGGCEHRSPRPRRRMDRWGHGPCHRRPGLRGRGRSH